MPNPLITVQSALYGAGSNSNVDVKAQTQTIFDQEYNATPTLNAFTLSTVLPATFGISDPAPYQVKTLTLTYRVKPVGMAQVFSQTDGGSVSLVVSNPLLTVQNALYGAPGNQVVDVTAATQAIIDGKYNVNPNLFTFSLHVSAAGFSILDPAPGAGKMFTMLYTMPGLGTGRTFMRGCGDGQDVVMTVGPIRTTTVQKAVYATSNLGLDVTAKLNAYLSDPGNSTTMTVGNQAFFNALTAGADPSPLTKKYFSAIYTVTPGAVARSVCGFDGQVVSLT